MASGELVSVQQTCESKREEVHCRPLSHSMAGPSRKPKALSSWNECFSFSNASSVFSQAPCPEAALSWLMRGAAAFLEAALCAPGKVTSSFFLPLKLPQPHSAPDSFLG